MKGIQKFLLAYAGMAIAFSVVYSPEFVAAYISSDGMLEHNTIIEIQVFRIAALIVGGGILTGLTLWRLGKTAAWERNLTREYANWRDPLRCLSGRNKHFLAVARIWLWLVVALVVATIVLSFEYYETSWFDLLAWENGVLENLQFAFLLGGGLLLLAVGKRSWRDRCNSAAIGGFLFASMLIFAAGEEVNWGQLWLGFETPEPLKEINVQGEFNVHNIGGYWADHLTMFLMFNFLVLWPAAGYLFPQIHFFMFRLGLPVAPLSLAPIALVGLLMDEHEVFSWMWGFPPWRLSEGRETVHAACIFVICMLLYRMQRDGCIRTPAADAMRGRISRDCVPVGTACSWFVMFRKGRNTRKHALP